MSRRLDPGALLARQAISSPQQARASACALLADAGRPRVALAWSVVV